MIYLLFADLVLLLHLLFIIWALLGGLMVLWRRYWLWVHLPALGWALWIEFTGGVCPLTPLENSLRQQGGAAGYGGDFIDHYLSALIYPAGLTTELQWLLGALLALLNGLIYLWVYRRRVRH